MRVAGASVVAVVVPLLLATAVGCAPAALPLPADHPALPGAPTGRLAGPPPALRKGAGRAMPPAAPATPGRHGSH
ncbi:MAG TPA: hypothetical protein VM734_32285 [Kofleriaceae bacterium]|nr:hypothetical protein [Kofleriaceae bacterium]